MVKVLSVTEAIEVSLCPVSILVADTSVLTAVSWACENCEVAVCCIIISHISGEVVHYWLIAVYHCDRNTREVC